MLQSLHLTQELTKRGSEECQLSMELLTPCEKRIRLWSSRLVLGAMINYDLNTAPKNASPLVGCTPSHTHFARKIFSQNKKLSIDHKPIREIVKDEPSEPNKVRVPSGCSIHKQLGAPHSSVQSCIFYKKSPCIALSVGCGELTVAVNSCLCRRNV